MSHSPTSLILNQVSFKYPEGIDSLFTRLNLAFYPGWTGIVGSNGSGKSTLLKLINGELEIDSGTIYSTGYACTVAQRTDHSPSDLDDLAAGSNDQMWYWRSKMEIQTDWFNRWGSLSHGERKRLQIALALSKEPDVLILDEPDNHLDAQSRDVLRNALKKYRGIGLIVSHDRHLLDTLCNHTLFLGSSLPDLRSGGYSAANQELEREQLEHQRQRDTLHKEEKKLRKELRRRSEESDRTKGKRSRRKLAPGDRDGRAKIGMAIYSGKDKKAGRLKQVMADRVEGLNHKRASIPFEKQFTRGIYLEGRPGHHQVLIDESAGSFQATDSLSISWPDLMQERGQRIALTGPNGSGKTLLLKHMMERSKLTTSDILYMPQEIPLSEGSKLIHQLNQLTSDEKGYALTIVSRLGSDPEGLLEGQVISPGESRKLLLALGMAQNASFLILDEPTNHLDLVAITCLEEALLEWPGGILLVSHDRYFVNTIAEIIWDLVPGANGESRIQITVPEDTKKP